MGEKLGRANKIKLDGTTVIAFRTLSESVSNSLIDITDSESDGFSTSLDQPGEKMVTYSIEGMVKDNVIRKKMMSGDINFDDAVIEYAFDADVHATGDTLTGDLKISEISFSMPYNEASTFSATLQTSGPYVWADAVPV